MADFQKIKECADQIYDFIETAPGLTCGEMESVEVQVTQTVDQKEIQIDLKNVDEILSRFDSLGKSFLQVNFKDGQKILLTQNLVGFKPAQLGGLDMEKVPRVVTTPDLISIIEAIEESMSSEDYHPVEVDVLRKVYKAVLDGGEAIGFDLRDERAWLSRITSITPSVA